MTSRLWGALAAYVILAAIAASLLHGTVLYAVLVLFAGLAFKTFIAEKAGWNSRSVSPDQAPDADPDSESEHQD